MHFAKRAWMCLLPLVLLAPAVALAAGPSDPVNVGDYKPPIRVACLGDSITFGVGANTGWSWPEQLDRMLGEKWDVRNYGRSGATIAKGDKYAIWTQKEYKAALEFHPDVVVILLGTNDTKPDNWAAKKDFSALYRDLVASFQKLSSKPRVFCGLPPYVAKKGAFGINEAGVKEQIPMIEAVAKDLGAGVIDVHGATEGKDAIFPDSVHPNTDGATLIAKAVYKVLAGKEFEGAVPAVQDVKKMRPAVIVVENPGELSYREAFAIIASEAGMSVQEIAPIRKKFEDACPVVEAKIMETEARIKEYDDLRMKFKHTTVEADKPLYGEYKGKVAEAQKELAKLKRDSNEQLLGMVPKEYKAAVGAACLRKYVYDRLLPVALSLAPEQRQRISGLCKAKGAAYAEINNTPERSVEEVELYKAVYEQVLDPEQKKRVDAR